MSRITLKIFPVTPQTLLTTENLCFKQKSNFFEKVLPPIRALKRAEAKILSNDLQILSDVTLVHDDDKYSNKA